jgi:hypothetical protein
MTFKFKERRIVLMSASSLLLRYLFNYKSCQLKSFNSLTMAPHRKNVIEDASTPHSHLTSEPTKISSAVTAFKPRRRLRFSLELNQVFPVVHIDDMDEADIHEIWYAKRDYKEIKKNLISIIRKMTNGENIVETHKQTLLGLEHRTREGTLLRGYLRLAALTAVMNEQERQWDEGVQDDERLAKVCRDVTSLCQEKSHAKALQDEAALKRDDKKMKRKLSRRKLALDLQNESALKEKRRFKLVKFPSARNLDSDSPEKSLVQNESALFPSAPRNLVSPKNFLPTPKKRASEAVV